MLRTRYDTKLNPQVALIRQQVRSSAQELRELIANPLQQLPTEKLYQAADEGEWTLMETLAHIIEFMPYWADEISKLLQNPDQRIGRTESDHARLHAIKKHGKDTLLQARLHLFISYTHLDRALRPLQDDDLQIEGLHVTLGRRPLAWLIETSIVHHLTEHIEQLQVDLLILNQVK